MLYVISIINTSIACQVCFANYLLAVIWMEKWELRTSHLEYVKKLLRQISIHSCQCGKQRVIITHRYTSHHWQPHVYCRFSRVHCKQAMNAIYHTARTICPPRYKMKMSCYFLVQDGEKIFSIFTWRFLWLCSCCVLGHCDSKNKDNDWATWMAFSFNRFIVPFSGSVHV